MVKNISLLNLFSFLSPFHVESLINLIGVMKKSVFKVKSLNLMWLILDFAIPKRILSELIHGKRLKCLLMHIITPFNFSVEHHNEVFTITSKRLWKKLAKGKNAFLMTLAMVNHFLIESVACTPAAGWEKGQVERQVQTLRKRFFLPMLAFDSLALTGMY